MDAEIWILYNFPITNINLLLNFFPNHLKMQEVFFSPYKTGGEPDMMCRPEFANPDYFPSLHYTHVHKHTSVHFHL